MIKRNMVIIIIVVKIDWRWCNLLPLISLVVKRLN